MGISIEDLLNAKESSSQEKQASELSDTFNAPVVSQPVPYIPEEQTSPYSDPTTEYDDRQIAQKISHSKQFLVAQIIAIVLSIIFAWEQESFLDKAIYFAQAVFIIGLFLRVLIMLFHGFRFMFGRRLYDTMGTKYIVPRNVLGAVASWFATVAILACYAKILSLCGTVGVYALYTLTGIYYLFCVYSDICTVKSHGVAMRPSKVRKAFIVIMVLLAFVGVVSGVIELANGDSREIDAETEPELTETQHQINAAFWENNPDELAALCKNALLKAQELENEEIADGYQIPIPSEIFGVYFLQAEESEWPHKNWANGVEFENAIAVITGYYVENTSGFTFERYEWQVWVFPGFAYDTVLSYEAENEYFDHIHADDYQEVLDWFKEEYNDVVMTEITIDQ